MHVQWLRPHHGQDGTVRVMNLDSIVLNCSIKLGAAQSACRQPGTATRQYRVRLDGCRETITHETLVLSDLAPSNTLSSSLSSLMKKPTRQLTFTAALLALRLWCVQSRNQGHKGSTLTASQYHNHLPAPLVEINKLPKHFSWCSNGAGNLCTPSWNQHVIH